MKALVIAEHADAATALAAGARGLADEVAVAIVGPEEVPASIADVAYGVAVPEGAVADDANETLAPLLEDVELVIAEPTRHIKSVAGKLAAFRGASVITDVMSFENGQASERRPAAAGRTVPRSHHDRGRASSTGKRSPYWTKACPISSRQPQEFSSHGARKRPRSSRLFVPAVGPLRFPRRPDSRGGS